MNPLASSLLAAVQLSQATRLLQLDTALAGATLLVERATLTESLHALEPLRAEVDCVSTEAGLPLKSLMGTRVALRLLQADGSPGEKLGQMDANGVLTLTLPALQQGVLDVQIDGGPGHRDYLSLPMREGVVQIDAVSQGETASPGWLALLGGAGAGAGLYGGTVLVGRVMRSRMG